ncbi:MAG: hypothetical protein IKW56_00725 [Methanocorpusculum sp.]|nr:hypothetical protein [Methanocorpusculum sp.]
MKKADFVSLVMGIVGVLLFGFGMSCCLVPELNAASAGIGLGIIGLIVLLVMLIVRRKMLGKPAVSLNAKTVGAVLIGILGALLFGIGFCLTAVVSGFFVIGIISAIAGIVLLLLLIPFCGKLT